MQPLDFPKVVLGLVLGLALGACQAIAGIEDRVLDPNAPEPTHSSKCQSYCDTVMNICTGDNAVYPTREQCLGVCAQMDPGDPQEPGGNTLACRAQEAKSAEREPDDHCKFLGPGGGGKCGSDCEAYCDLFPKLCPDDVVYRKTAACLKACSGLVDLDRFDVLKDHDGDTLECRLVHLSAAAANPKVHCPHAQMAPSEPYCTGKAEDAPTCSEYCKITMAACDGAFQQYVDEQQCRDVCAALPLGTNADRVTNTVGCRRFHAFSSTLTPESHCWHAGPTGDGHCGELNGGNCESYCALLEAACPAEFATEMASADQCLLKCAQLDESGGDSLYSLENAAKSTGLSCRVAAVASAFAEPAACAAAIGGAPCAP